MGHGCECGLVTLAWRRCEQAYSWQKSILDVAVFVGQSDAIFISVRTDMRQEIFINARPNDHVAESDKRSRNGAERCSSV